MKELTGSEIKTFAVTLGFTVAEALYICDTFYNEKAKGNFRLKNTELSNVDDYVREWENYWFRYYGWENLVQSEIDQGPGGLTEIECISLIGKAIFPICDGLFIQTVY